MAAYSQCNHLLIGVCGSIHALNIHAYLVRLHESFAGTIKVIMTASACRMVEAETVALYSNDRVFSDLWDRSPEVDRVAHIQLTQWADLFGIVPATANVLGQAAHGMADDLLSTAILSYTKPVVFAPAMNAAMWHSRAVQRNVQTLVGDGHYIVPPEPAPGLMGSNGEAALAPSPETVLLHLQHVRMKELKESYWGDATREKPLTPAQRKLRAFVSAGKDVGMREST